MNKRIVSLVICLIFALSAMSVSAKTIQFTMNSTDADILEDKVTTQVIETAPYTKNDRTMVPVRLINEQFGATVGWDENTKTVTITKGADVISLTLDNNSAIVNGEAVILDAAPEQVNDRTMVPVRFISETLGYNVKYVESTEQVLITDEKPLFEIYGVKIFPCEFGAMANFEKQSYIINEENVGEFVATELNNFENHYKLVGSITEEDKNNGVVLSYELKNQFRKAVPKYMENCSDVALSGAMALVIENMNLSGIYQNYLYDKAMASIDDKAVLDEYKNNYVCAKHILVSNTNENAKKNIEEIKKALKGKADFDSLIAQYGEDPGMENNPGGYVFTKDEMVQEFEKSAFELKENEVSGAVETTYGTHFIKKLPLPEITESVSAKIKEALAYPGLVELINSKVAVSDAKSNYTIEELAELIK